MRRGTDVDRLIRAIATANNGVITARGLRAAGVGRRAVAHRLAIGRLYRIHLGVYLLDPPREASRITLLTAAVAACGENAVLSHRSAAELWGLLPPRRGDIDVTIVGGNAGVRQGIRRHRVPALDETDIRTKRGIRVTSPARTVLDGASYLYGAELEEFVAEALAKEVNRRKLEAAIERYPTRRGVRRLQVLLRQEGGPRRTRSWAERRIVSLVRQAGLPVPRTNVLLHGYQVDALWPEHRLVVEVDSWGFHRDRTAFETDRARDATHVAKGYRVLRFTAAQLRDQPMIVIAQLSAALALAAFEAGLTPPPQSRTLAPAPSHRQPA